MSDKGSKVYLSLHRLPDGGYVVLDGRDREDFTVSRGPLFASTTIEEALRYMRDMIFPIDVKSA